ncbi:DUF3427 domain-containing protein [Synechococcus elongatus IITB4]|uniref:DUF3427 domain-containing protein n=1 Tax=Synechococcus elongatus TaxID=32046 RepID=UPI0030D0D4AC
MVQEPLPTGLYEQLISLDLQRQLQQVPAERIELENLDPAEAPQQLAHYLRSLVAIALPHLSGKDKVAAQIELINRLVEVLRTAAPKAIATDDQLLNPSQRLTEIRSHRLLPGQAGVSRPLIPLSNSTLLVNATGEPNVGQALQQELPSADRVDLLCAFIKWSGLRLLQDRLKTYLESGRSLRVLTTVYLGATDRRALDWLVGQGAEVRVSYDTRRTRLHAKAWFFHRQSGYDTAYIGSSNLSTAALQDGLEWNVRLSGVDNPSILSKFQAAFESYWEEGEFEPYRASEQEQYRFDRALGREQSDTSATIAFFDIHPYAYQQEILERLQAERLLHDRWRNLVVAATGTGKTVMAALDYARLSRDFPKFAGTASPRLLFVAHRKEILQQSLSTFRMVLKQGDFGELLVDGQRPQQWQHVFASVQSLAGLDPNQLAADRFAVVIVDEFHHAAADSYRHWLDYLQPQLLLGLTATPERSDGETILNWFDNRITAELRLWTALDQGLLCPFHYFGIHDSTDLSRLQWRRGGYVSEELSALYTGDDARLRLILKELFDKVPDVSRMRALGFCVSVEHAHYMAHKFQSAGISAIALDGSCDRHTRREAIQQLRRGELQIIFAVDLFNEGLDIPEINTILLLRPTESATVFLQQLGRGLRLHPDKDCLTVLDFIGQAHRQFRYDWRYRALLGGSRQQFKEQLEQEFPFLPAGCSLQLDRVAQRIILDNLKQSLPSRRSQLLQEAARLGRCSLPEFLTALGLELADFYRLAGSWTRLQRDLGWRRDSPHPDEDRLGRAIASLSHIDDPQRLQFYQQQLSQPTPPDLQHCSSQEQRLWQMLMVQVWGTGKQYVALSEALSRFWAAIAIREELQALFELLVESTDHLVRPLSWTQPIPLQVHGRYSRAEILAAFGALNNQQRYLSREGVYFEPTSQSDLLFVTLNKSEKLFSPTTRYNDYAISPTEFHWESQSTTRATSPTGQRYIHHRDRGSYVILFVRESRQQNGQTLPFLCLGFADYVRHQGDRPMAIRWRLHHPIPAALYPTIAIAV